MQKLIDRALTVAKSIAAGAVWLWRLPPIRSVIMTQIVRIGLGSTAVAIITSIIDGLATGG